MSLYSAYDSASHRLRIDYSHTTNAAARTYTISASATIENLNTNQVDGYTARIYIGGIYKNVSISGAWEGNVSVYMGSYSRTFGYDNNGNGSATVQGQLISGTGGSGGWTNSVNVIPPSIAPIVIDNSAKISWFSNFVNATVPLGVGINNPYGCLCEAYLYINGHNDVCFKNGISGTFSWDFTLAEAVAIINAMDGQTSCSYEVHLVSYINGQNIGINVLGGTCYRPNAHQVSLGKNNFNIGETIAIFSGADTPYIRHSLYLGYGAISAKTITTDLNYYYEWDTDANQDLYSQIPNNNSGIGAIIQNTFVGDIYIGQTQANFTCNVINSNPTFNNFTYADTNANTLALTGSSAKIVKGYSNVKATISIANKAVALNSANMSKYTFKNGSKTQVDGTYSDSADVGVTINGVDATTMEIYAIDSRGNSTKKEILASTFLDYSPINVLSGTITRDTGGIGTGVTLNFNGTIWNKTFGSILNGVVSCIYKYKLTTSTTWITGTTDITPILSGDTYSKSVSIAGDLGASGFNSSLSYDIQVIITDKLSTKTFPITLQSGIPQLAFGIGSGVAVGAFYDTNVGGSFQIDGKNASGIETIVNANGIARKYTDGTVEIFQRVSINQAISSVWSNHYISGAIQLPNFPIAMLSYYSCNLTLEGNNGRNAWVMTSGPNSLNKVGAFYMISPENIPVFNGYVNVHATGTWK